MKVSKVLTSRLSELKRDIEHSLLDMLIAKGLTTSTGIFTLSMGDNPVVIYNDGMSGAATITQVRIANARSIRVVVDTDYREDMYSIEELDPLTVIKLIEQIENDEYEIV